MPDIVINPSLGKIDFFTTKGDQVTNSIRLVDASTILFTGAVSASAISNGSGSFVTAVQPTSNYLNKFTGNASIANSLIYDNGTNIGIGTTAPTSKLHIVTTGTNDGIILDGSSNPIFVHRTSGTDRTYLTTTTSAGAFFTDAGQYDFVIRSQENNILFGRGSGTSTMAIVGNKVGINTTVPSASLQINSTTAGATVLRTDGTNGTLFSVVDDLSDSLMSVNNSAGLPVLEVFADDRIIGGQYGQNDFAVVNNKVGIGTNNPIAKLHVSSSSSTPSAAFLGGNVGIGTSSPGQKLEVVTVSNTRIRINSTEVVATEYFRSGTGLWLVGSDSSNSFKIARASNFGTNDYLSINSATADVTFFDTALGARMTLNSTGLGIGTTSPKQKLTIVGEISLRNGDGYYWNAYYSSGFKYIGTGYAGYTIVDSTGAYTINTTNSSGTADAVASMVTRLYISSSGYVGIGTSSPTRKLDVNGDANIGTNLVVGSGIYNANYYAGSSTATYFKNSVGTDTLTILQGGNVGIGTTSPVDKLHVIGNIRINGGDILNWGGQAFIQTIGANDMFFRPNSTLQMILQANGNLGIGSSFTTPSAKLHVSGSSTSLSAIFNGCVGIGTTTASTILTISKPIDDAAYGSGSRAIDFKLYYPGFDTDSVKASIYVGVSKEGTLQTTKGYLAFLTSATSGSQNLTEKMRIESDGNVGIGTSTVGGLLSLHGTYPQLVANNPTTGSGVVIQLRDNGRDAGFMGHSTTTARLQFGSKGYNAAHMTISEDGDVGVGTTSPTAQSNYRFLQVNGTNSAVIETMVGGTRIGGFDSSASALYVGSIGSYPVIFRTAVNEKMRIATDGNVGIGTSSPSQLLEVAGSSPIIRVLATSGNSTLRLTDNGVRNWDLKVVDTSDYFEVGGTNTTSLIVTGTGNVGIGDSAPSYKLDVSGSVRVYGPTGGVIIRDGTASKGNIRPSVGNGSILISDDSSSQTRGMTVNNNGGITVSTANASQNIIEGQANGSQVMCLNYNGNIGLGTSSPIAKLDVRPATDGDAGISIGTGGSISGTIVSPANLFINANTGNAQSGAGQIAFGFQRTGFTGGSEVMRITEAGGGNVGIGTTVPGASLHVNSTTAGATLLRTDGTNGTLFSVVDDLSDSLMSVNNSAGLPVLEVFANDRIVGGQYGQNDFVVINNNVGIGTNNPIAKLHVTSSASTTAALFQGKVGIGSATPSYNLDVYNGSGWSGVDLNGSSGGELRFLQSGVLKANIYASTSAGFIINGGSETIFHIGGSEKMRLTGANLGIGTSSPVGRLDVRGGIEYLNTSGSTSTSTSGSLMILGQNTRGGSTYHDFLFVSHTSASATNPQKSFRLNNTGAIEIINSAYTTTIFSLTDAGVLSTPGGGTSDIRTKQNVEYIYEDVSTTINKLKPVKFEFKDNPNVKRHGFIAQDVLPIKPDLVLGDGDKPNGTYGLDYDGILALTVKALQESNIKIKELENRISQLENKS
jgi:hypothetical protein